MAYGLYQVRLVTEALASRFYGHVALATSAVVIQHSGAENLVRLWSLTYRSSPKWPFYSSICPFAICLAQLIYTHVLFAFDRGWGLSDPLCPLVRLVYLFIVCRSSYFLQGSLLDYSQSHVHHC